MVSEYYEKNRDKIIARSSRRYEEKRDIILAQRAAKRSDDPEAYRKYVRDYYQSNKKKLAAMEKERYWKNRDTKLVIARNSYQRNKTNVKKRVKKYRKKNPEMVKKFADKRYKMESEAFGVTADAYRYAIMAWKGCVMKRDGCKCVYCGRRGKRANLEAHHIIFRKTNKLMAFIENNGVMLCRRCHREVHRLNPIKYGRRKRLQL